MTQEIAVEIFSGAIMKIITMSAPMLLSALLVGLIISVFQATTQIQEQTLAFVPKVLAIFLVLMLAGPWLLNTIVEFTLSIFNNIDKLIM